eukprot:TRINITY_DN48519_c0_g1_i1.p1 TRINITY_DN48519_c0_g1~~TRINITY_DN48519_c0_g1_i1.p1  ORF type:complete len:653 (+),score=115.39 TRINITY_DN48519_c0_g1_i1:281-1960(+)
MSDKICKKLCIRDHKCVAAELGPFQETFNCWLLFGTGDDFHLSCSHYSKAMCFRKVGQTTMRDETSGPASKEKMDKFMSRWGGPDGPLVSPAAAPAASETTLVPLIHAGSIDKAPVSTITTTRPPPDSPRMDMGLVAQVSVGTPPQELTVLLDSGSSDIWLPSRGCNGCGSSGTFDVLASTTAKVLPAPPGKQVSTRLDGSRTVSARVVQDTIVIAGITLPHQTFLVADQSKDSQNDGAHMKGFDGVIGLGTPELVDGPAFCDALAAAGVPPIFTFVPSQKDFSARLLLGKDSFKNVVQEGTLQWLQSSSARFWQITGQIAFVTNTEPRTLLVDTGTSVLRMPEEDLALLLRTIQPFIQGQRCTLDPSTSIAYCPCVDVSNMKPLGITLGDHQFKLSAKDLFEETGLPMGSGPSPDEAACRLLVSVIPAGSGMAQAWVLGDTFLQSVVTVFDVLQRRVGFAEVASLDEASITSSSSPTEVAHEVATSVYHGHPSKLYLEEEAMKSRRAFAHQIALIAAALLVAAAGYITITAELAARKEREKTATLVRPLSQRSSHSIE